MRQQFIYHSDNTDAREGDSVAATISEAEDLAPWAAEIIEVDGGFQAFESVDDAETWRSQA